MEKKMINKALFLDRDGIINVDKGYVFLYEDIVWIEETLEMIKLANDKGYKVIVLTNQSGVFRKMYSEDQVIKLHHLMAEYLKSKGLKIDDWFYCPELESESRKPRPGMLLAAQKKYSIDLSLSFMVGDKPSDVFDTDGNFKRPHTLLVRGNYQIADTMLEKDVRVLENHKEVLEILKKEMVE
jgi:D-glycero-D-manno-heptose 1,7-bisphosphate phosphatase